MEAEMEVNVIKIAEVQEQQSVVSKINTTSFQTRVFPELFFFLLLESGVMITE